jgi:hypothetical protein
MRARLPPGSYKNLAEDLTHESSLAYDAALLWQCGKSKGDSSELEAFYALAGSMGNGLRSLDKALRGPHASKWEAALNYEIGQLEKLRTWRIVDHPTDEPVIPHSFVFREKPDANHNVITR